MPLKAGTNTDPFGFADSMADAMAQAFKEEWPYVMGDAPIPETSKEMKLLFAAVARGVVKHLQAHASDFKVRVTATGYGDYTGTVTQID
jgi:hypothetical protein